MRSRGSQRLCTWTAAVVAAGACAPSSNGDVLYSTSFESPAFNTGDLHGQSGWSTTTSGSVSIGLLSISSDAARARSGIGFAEVDTDGWSISAGVTIRSGWRPTTRTRTQVLANGGVIRSTVNMWLTPATGSRVSGGGLSVYGNGGFSLLGSLYLYTTGEVRAFPAGSNVAGASVTAAQDTDFLGRWIRLQIDTNFALNRTSYMVDGVDLTQNLVNMGFNNSISGAVNAWSDASMVAYQFTSDPSAVQGGSMIRFDDYRVELVPAPGPTGILCLGGMVALTRRRR